VEEKGRISAEEWIQLLATAGREIDRDNPHIRYRVRYLESTTDVERRAVLREYIEKYPERDRQLPFLREQLEEAGIVAAAALESGQESVGERADEAVFTHSVDYRSIRFKGQAHTLTCNQATIIRILHEALQRATPSVGKATLLAAVESETSRLQDFFRGSPLWQKLVVRGDHKGTYRLNFPPQG
jgi:hypothetical protein